jgi:hypothetical protein
MTERDLRSSSSASALARPIERSYAFGHRNLSADLPEPILDSGYSYPSSTA